MKFDSKDLLQQTVAEADEKDHHCISVNHPNTQLERGLPLSWLAPAYSTCLLTIPVPNSVLQSRILGLAEIIGFFVLSSDRICFL